MSSEWTEAQKTAMAERRMKVFYCDYYYLCEIFETWNDWHTLVLPVFTESFQGTKIVSVHLSEEHRAFGFVMCHPDWPSVPDGERMPRLENSIEHVLVKRIVADVFQVPGTLPTELAGIPVEIDEDHKEPEVKFRQWT